MRFYKDPLVRRFVSGSLFAGAFVWVAVRFFDVDTEVVWVLFVMSFIFVFGMMFVGLALSLLVRLFRSRGGGMLDRIEAAEREAEEAGAEKAEPEPAASTRESG